MFFAKISPYRFQEKSYFISQLLLMSKSLKKLLNSFLAPGKNRVKVKTSFRRWTDVVCLGVSACHNETRLSFSFDYTLFFNKKLRSRVAPQSFLKITPFQHSKFFKSFLISQLVELCFPNVLITLIIENIAVLKLDKLEIYVMIGSEQDIRELIL